MDQAGQAMQESPARLLEDVAEMEGTHPLPSRERPQLNKHAEEAKAEAKAEAKERRTNRRLSKTPQTVGRIVRSDIRIRRLSKILKIG